MPSGILVGVSGMEGTHLLERLPEGVPAFRILVVDDDASLRKACCEIASGMGFVPLAADSVPEALTVLRQTAGGDATARPEAARRRRAEAA